LIGSSNPSTYETRQTSSRLPQQECHSSGNRNKGFQLYLTRVRPRTSATLRTYAASNRNSVSYISGLSERVMMKVSNLTHWFGAVLMNTLYFAACGNSGHPINSGSGGGGGRATSGGSAGIVGGTGGAGTGGQATGGAGIGGAGTGGQAGTGIGGAGTGGKATGGAGIGGAGIGGAATGGTGIGGAGTGGQASTGTGGSGMGGAGTGGKSASGTGGSGGAATGGQAGTGTGGATSSGGVVTGGQIGGSLASSTLVNTYDGARATTVSFDLGWKFHLGDVSGAQAASFDDTSWTSLDVQPKLKGYL
jgi:hypothetical protein